MQNIIHIHYSLMKQEKLASLLYIDWNLGSAEYYMSGADQLASCEKERYKNLLHQVGTKSAGKTSYGQFTCFRNTCQHQLLELLVVKFSFKETKSTALLYYAAEIREVDYVGGCPEGYLLYTISYSKSDHDYKRADDYKVFAKFI